jgi:glycerophosphoryl diester phosphodiesterase
MADHDDRPQLIAHRGYSECYPENTLAGLEAALSAGADCIEFDVQFSKDGVPVVIHDNELRRTTGMDGFVNQTTAAQLASIYAGEEQRFGDQFSHERIPTLIAVLKLLDQWPNATAFVEIKEETVEHFGVEAVARQMISELASYDNRCVLISFDYAVIEAAKRLGIKRTGWVIRKWGDDSLLLAQKIKPDVLLCNYEKIPDIDNVLWQGPWQWALYDVVDSDIALRWIHRGVHFIESWDVGGLLSQKNLVSVLEGTGHG